MATEKAQKKSTDAEFDQMFPNWVYQIPGFVLIAGGFGGLAFLTLA